MKIASYFLAAVCLCGGEASGAVKVHYEAKVRVACIGDSITWGYAMTNRVAECYPEGGAQRVIAEITAKCILRR